MAEFHMYSSENFMRLAGKYLSQEVQESAIEEVAARLQRQPHDSDQLKPEPKILSDGDQPQKPFVPSDYSQVNEPKASAIVAEEE